uniref:Uncharacterized protein n=1 Tax=Ananas comosus var. bracteatus TaxID=296719 RepID=A0A6V7QAY3_ANACO|nr:unnamed protein product [Ananas comosus var. bracteatus]
MAKPSFPSPPSSSSSSSSSSRSSTIPPQPWSPAPRTTCSPSSGSPRPPPNTVASYSLSADGDFVVELEAPCYVQFSNLVYYEKTIKGKLSYGAISDLSGIQVKKLFVWLPVTGSSPTPIPGASSSRWGSSRNRSPSTSSRPSPFARPTPGISPN